MLTSVAVQIMSNASKRKLVCGSWKRLVDQNLSKFIPDGMEIVSMLEEIRDYDVFNQINDQIKRMILQNLFGDDSPLVEFSMNSISASCSQ